MKVSETCLKNHTKLLKNIVKVNHVKKLCIKEDALISM